MTINVNMEDNMELSPEHEQVREQARATVMAYIAGLVVKEEADE